jgi:glyceraldehyde 3-phosphate dehydrogenase
MEVRSESRDMEGVRVGVNGTGVIGRDSMRRLVTKFGPGVIAAVNDPFVKPERLASLLGWEEPYRKWEDHEVEPTKNGIVINGTEIPVTGYRDPSEIPWKENGVLRKEGRDGMVIESSGVFRNSEKAGAHLKGLGENGMVLISAPPVGEVDRTITYGVNHEMLSPNDRIVSAASCTTMCSATMLKVLLQIFSTDEGKREILGGHLETIHSYTSDQRLHGDGAHKDPRRMHGVKGAIINTSTGAARALAKVLPELKVSLGASSVRVDAEAVSKVVLNLVLNEPISMDFVNAEIRKSVGNLVAVDDKNSINRHFIGDEHSVIFDERFNAVSGPLLHVEGWYDNVRGYVSRLVDLAVLMLNQEKSRISSSFVS